MKIAAIAGYSGLVGSILLKKLVEKESYKEILCIGRKPPQIESNKIKYFNTNFETIPHIDTKNVDEFYCCLGTTIKKAETKENFRKIDFDAVIELARWTKQFPICRYVVISSTGAHSASKNFYLQTKGQMENTLKNLNLHSLIILRPSLLLGQRNEKRILEKIFQIIMPLFSILLIGSLKKYRAVEATSVANAMIEYANSKFGDTYIVESNEIQKF